MKSSLLAAIATGIAGLLCAPHAAAWADLKFGILGAQKPGRHITLYCESINPTACKQGIDSGYVQPWNPLDGDRWSRYRLAMDKDTVWFDFYDTREGCPVGEGWRRGFKWLLYTVRADGSTLGPYTICTQHEDYTRREYLKLVARWDEGSSVYQIDFKRLGQWNNPGVVFLFDPVTRNLVPTLNP